MRKACPAPSCAVFLEDREHTAHRRDFHSPIAFVDLGDGEVLVVCPQGETEEELQYPCYYCSLHCPTTWNSKQELQSHFDDTHVQSFRQTQGVLVSDDVLEPLQLLLNTRYHLLSCKSCQCGLQLADVATHLTNTHHISPLATLIETLQHRHNTTNRETFRKMLPDNPLPIKGISIHKTALICPVENCNVARKDMKSFRTHKSQSHKSIAVGMPIETWTQQVFNSPFPHIVVQQVEELLPPNGATLFDTYLEDYPGKTCTDFRNLGEQDQTPFLRKLGWPAFIGQLQGCDTPFTPAEFASLVSPQKWSEKRWCSLRAACSKLMLDAETLLASCSELPLKWINSKR